MVVLDLLRQGDYRNTETCLKVYLYGFLQPGTRSVGRFHDVPTPHTLLCCVDLPTRLSSPAHVFAIVDFLQEVVAAVEVCNKPCDVVFAFVIAGYVTQILARLCLFKDPIQCAVQEIDRQFYGRLKVLYDKWINFEIPLPESIPPRPRTTIAKEFSDQARAYCVSLAHMAALLDGVAPPLTAALGTLCLVVNANETFSLFSFFPPQ